MSRNILNTNSNVYVNTVSGGSAILVNTISNQTESTINLNINKETLKTTPISTDEFILQETNNGLIKKITYSSMIDGIDNYTGSLPIIVNRWSYHIPNNSN